MTADRPPALEPLDIKPVSVTLEFEDVTGGAAMFRAGLRQAWFELGNDTRKAEVAVGAGLGSPYMTLTVEHDGEVRYYDVDVAEAMRPLLEELLDAVAGDREGGHDGS